MLKSICYRKEVRDDNLALLIVLKQFIPGRARLNSDKNHDEISLQYLNFYFGH